jgi:hypothetical protein
MRFIDLFAAMLDYHQKTRHHPYCKDIGDKVEKMLNEWDRQQPLDSARPREKKG